MGSALEMGVLLCLNWDHLGHGSAVYSDPGTSPGTGLTPLFQDRYLSGDR